MRNRFMLYEVYEEWFEGRISRARWREFVMRAPGLELFRHVMFHRLVPRITSYNVCYTKLLRPGSSPKRVDRSSSALCPTCVPSDRGGLPRWKGE